ncbi:MAG: transcription elongation factor GreA, partial [Nitrospirae bacterium]|nr:transcription elongation factor GreA [Nitrospirota bacterium]
MMKKIPMTKAGYEKLRSDLEHLVKVERSKNIQAISEARAHGDLSENAEYHAAKERQSFIEGRIQELQAKIAHAQVIDVASIQHSKVVFGATVALEEGESGEERSYTI